MKGRMRNRVIFLNIVLITAFVFFNVISKETLRKKGELVYFQLAPVDPRSLMQGDYMTLRYNGFSTMEESWEDISRGYLVFTLDDQNVASPIRLQKSTSGLKDGEYVIRFYAGSRGRIKIGAESYFFQEGRGDTFSDAVYGGIRVNTKGDKILVGLYNKDFELLGL